jgi:hypothetical protein
MVLAAALCAIAPIAAAQVTRYVRYSTAGRISHGMLEGDRIRELAGPP